MTRKQGESGFTLIETLVSIALLALLVAFLPGLLQMGMTALHSQSELDAISGRGPARQYLSQRLASATPALQRQADGRLRLAFAGRSSELSFVAPAALGEEHSGIQAYRVALVNTGLELTARPYVIDGPAEARTSVLMHAVTSLNLRYFGQLGGEDGARWHDEWIGESHLPQLVELRTGFSDRRSAFERPLVVSLRLANLD